ncbi:hypothetical protein EC968_005846 [Mortierella alpina]|nr:hypothetical protein EC968_005846 [Mortierella alpina]
MFPVPVTPTRNLSQISEQAAEKNSPQAGGLVAKSDAMAAILWTGLLKKGMSVLKTVTNRTTTAPFAEQVMIPKSDKVSKDHACKLKTSAPSIDSTQASEREHEETADPRLGCTAASCHSQVQTSGTLNGPHSGKQTLRPNLSYANLRVIFVFFGVGMIISAMNVWHLYNAVSSVVEVLQLSHEPIQLNGASSEQYLVGIQRGTFQGKQHHFHETLAPIQKQKDLLRAEIIELMLKLDSARRSLKEDQDNSN